MRQKRNYFHCSCGFEFSLDSITGESETPELYNESYYRHWDVEKRGDSPATIGKNVTFSSWFSLIEHFTAHDGTLLDIGCATGHFCSIARKHGWQVQGLELSAYAAEVAKKRLGDVVFCGNLAAAPYSAGQFSLVTAFDVIEHIGAPDVFIAEVTKLLSRNGIFALSTPDTASVSRKIFGKRWFQFKPEHCSYFSPKTIQTLLSRHGFTIVHTGTARKKLPLSYISSYLNTYTSGTLSRQFSAILSRSPRFFSHTPLYIPTGEMLVIAKKTN